MSLYDPTDKGFGAAGTQQFREQREALVFELSESKFDLIDESAEGNEPAHNESGTTSGPIITPYLPLISDFYWDLTAVPPPRRKGNVRQLTHPHLHEQEKPSMDDPRWKLLWRNIKNEWFTIFNSQPFTSFAMVDYLVEQAGISYVELWTEPNILQDKIVKTNLKKTSKLASLFDKPGRCTVFAIQMEESIQRQRIPDFDFDFHDNGPHRFARCKETGALIDTNVECGPILLQEGEFVIRGNDFRPGTYWYESGISHFDRLDRPVSVRSVESEAQQQCLCADLC